MGALVLLAAAALLGDPAAAAEPAAQLTRAPEPLEGRAPPYPAEALANASEATVALRVTIDETGAVARVDIAESAGADAVGRARARPAQQPCRGR